MSFLTKLFGKPKEKINLPVTEVGEKKPEPKAEDAGTTLRKPEQVPAPPQKKKGPDLSALEIAKRQDWEVKTLPEWNPGDVILDTYEIEDKIPGGMGYVYIANHNKWRVKLAIKSPNEKMLSDRDLFARVLREANSWTELGLHPNIAYCYYVRNIEEVPHIIIEYVDGGNLEQWIEDGKCIDYRTNLDLAIQFCHGMEYAHSRGLIHRDIKPKNILMTRNGILKVTDFGLVRGDGSSAYQKGSTSKVHGLTTIGTHMGTEGYMAPEQAASASQVDERADIFSFGICLYEMFCGNKPYDITYGKKQEAPDPIALSRDSEFPSGIAAVLTKCVQWDPQHRYSDFTQIRNELSTIYTTLFNESSPYAQLDLLDLESDGLNNQGVAYFELNRREDALRCWEKALEINSTHPEATYNLSLVQWRNGKIPDDEVLQRIDNCSKPSVDKERLAELKAYIHAERFAPDDAETVLKDFPGRYEELFSEKDISLIKWIRIMEGHTKRVSSIAVTPNGRYAVSGSFDKTLRVWELKTGKCIRIMEGHTHGVCSVAITPDGKHAISGSFDKTLRVWELKTGKCIRIMEGHTHGVRSVAITPDGKHAISGSHDKTLRVWELQTGQCLRTIEGHTKSVESVAITLDGRYAVVSEGFYETLRLLELETGKCIRIMKGHTNYVHSVALTPDGKHAVSGSWDNTLRVWELKTGKCVNTMEGHTKRVISIAVTPDGRYAICGSEEHTLMLFETPLDKSYQSEVMPSLPKGFEQRKKELERLKKTIIKIEEYYKKGDYTKSLAILFKAWEDIGFGHNDAINRFYSMLMEKGRIKSLVLCFQKNLLKGHTKRVSSIAVTPNGRYVVSGSWDNTLRVWELKTGKCIRIIEGHTSSVCSVAITPDGKHAISGSFDDTLRLWELKTGKCVKTMEVIFGKSYHSVSVSPDGHYVVSVSWGKDLRVWELKTGKCINTMEGHTDIVSSIAVTPDGRYAVSGSFDDTLRLWELKTGKCVKTMEGHTKRVSSIAVTPNGRYAVSGSEDKTLRVWELKTGKCVNTIKGHTNWIFSVAVTPGGRYAVSGSDDKTLRVWELETGKCIRTTEGHTDKVTSVALTPNGRYAVSGSHDKTLRVWEFIWDLEF